MPTVIFKATEACNAKCVYCDVVHKDAPVIRKMRPELLELFFRRVNEFLVEKPGETMQIIWHGGEPLLLGPEFFALAAELQQKHCGATRPRICHAIQTNLTLFSPQFTAPLHALGIRHVGTSYDPIPAVRGLGQACDSQAYNRRFMEGVRLLESEGFGWGVIYVVTKLSLPRPLDIFHFLTNVNPGGGIMFNPILLNEIGPQDLKITPEEFVDFLGAIFPIWWRHRARYPQVAPFSSLVQNLVDKQRALSCCDSGECAHTHINLAPDGRLSQCGRAFDYGLLDYGSIRDRSFSEVMADPQRDELMRRDKVLSEGECKDCRFWSICHGGCPLDAWAETKSFMHKCAWCYAKKGLIEKYFEPIVGAAAGAAPSPPPEASDDPQNRAETQSAKVGRPTNGHKHAATSAANHDVLWIDPIGGLGDTLMISGVLKKVLEKDPSRRFHLVARTKYGPILKDHPAIDRIGHPPVGARFIRTSYWEDDAYGTQRAYQILARMFGLALPVSEELFVPWAMQDDPDLMRAIPWKQRNILIAPASDSPRKEMPAQKWESFVERMAGEGVNVVQAGRRSDKYIRGCFSLLGLTSPKQIISLIRHFDVLVTSDNFLMHAAHLCRVPAVVLWGPTDHRIYGYQEQIHLQTCPPCTFQKGCIGPGLGQQYASVCPEGAGHCLNQIDLGTLHQVVQKILSTETARSPGMTPAR